MKGQIDIKRRAGVEPALYIDIAPVFLNDLTRDGESEPASLMFGRKEGIEDALQVLRRDSTPRVCELDLDVGFSSGFDVGPCFYYDFTVFSRCIDRID